MGEISTKIADVSIFTAEDPRSENVQKIIGQMAKGVKKSKARKIDKSCIDELIHLYKKLLFLEIPERGEAISFAIQKLAKKGDTVAIIGKGHEKSMAYKGVEYPWSDREAVRIALKGGVKEIIR